MKTLLALTAGLMMLGAAPATPTNWLDTASVGPNGAIVTGKPNAKVRLVEYVSYTCGHCARFIGEASSPLKRDYIAKGLVAVELRNAVANQFDFTASLVARCGAPNRFHGNTELIMATQAQWMGQANGFLKANGPRLSKMPIDAQLKAAVRGLGLDRIMAKRGYTAAQLDTCVTNKAAQNTLLSLTREALETQKISGTPTFVINGTTLENAGSWTIVEPAIKTALGVQ